MKNFRISLLWLLPILIVYLFICQYLLLIPLNLHSALFLFELFFLVLILLLFVLLGKRNQKSISHPYLLFVPGILLIVALLIGGPYTGGLKNYRNQSQITDAEFAQIPVFDVTQVQLVDKNTAAQIGDRVFGTLGSDEVSQYDIGDDWVQISMNGKLYRVTPIDFGGLFKYFVTGTTPGYVYVDCLSGEAELIRTEGMKYMTSAYFGHNLYRHLFFKDPFALFGTAKFELDDQGHPYWVTPVFSVTWISKTRDVKGIYLTDPITGETAYYAKDAVPQWVDNIYPISVIYDQFSQSKRYENGLFNWSKKGIVEFTDDYAYVQFDSHVYIYTGITSVGKDESNVGFAYIDLRDGKILSIKRAGAEEYSARSSAEGALQQYHYSAIFPSMVNVDNKPTYFMGMVDGANLIKSYAFVSYENYQTVAVGATVDEAYQNYLKLIRGDSIDHDQLQQEEIVISDLMTIVRNGNTVLLLKDENGRIFNYDISSGDLRSAFLKKGDKIIARFMEDGSILSFDIAE